MNIICMICRQDKDVEEDFIVPRDAIGLVLIEEHFKDKHPEEYEKYLAYKAEQIAKT